MPISEGKIILMEMMEHKNTLVFQTMQKHFHLSNEDQIGKWKSKALSNQYLHVLATIGDVVLSKPIKPMHVIFKGKGTLVQNHNDIISGGPIINTSIAHKTSPTSPWELMDPRTKNDSDKTQDIRIPFDPLTAHKIDILIKQFLCQFEGLLVF